MITSPVLFARFTGRESELLRLLEFMHHAERSSTGATVLISAEAGVGKSRLLAEFTEAVTRERGLVAATTCDESVQYPYSPMIALIDALAKKRAARDSLELAAARKRLTEPLAVGAAAHDAGLAQRYTAVVDALSDVAARAGALAFAIDDLQWCDPSTLDLIRYLTRELPSTPIVLLLAYRNDDRLDPRFASALAKIERERAVRLQLEPLADTLIRRAIAETLGTDRSLPASTIERVCELAEGKPYVAEELLRGALERTDGASSRLSAPTSLRAAVLERVDELAPFEREVLSHAAIVGRTFSADLLARILSDGSPAAVLRALRAARNAQIVRETPDGSFEFRHALTREILYGEFLAAETRLLHRTIADELERESDRASLLGEIAYHRWLARDGERSAAANEAAGDRSAELSAYADALRSFERALETLDPHTARAAALFEKVAHAAIMVGEVARAQTATAAASAAFRESGDEHNARRMIFWSARQAQLRGDHASALAILAEAKRDLETRGGSPSEFVAADVAFASIAVSHGDAAEALATADRLFAGATPLSPEEAFHLHHTRGTALVRLGRYEEAGTEYEAAETLALERRDTYGALSSVNSRATAAGLAGRYEIARAAFEVALERAVQTGVEHTMSLIAANAAFWEVLVGDLEVARRKVAAATTRRASVHATPTANAVAVRVATMRGDRSNDVRESADAARAAALALDHGVLIVLTAGAAALAAIADGRTSEARASIADGLGRLENFDPSSFWLIEAVARAGSEDERSRARALLARASGGSSSALEGYRALFEALALEPSANRLVRTDYARKAVAAFAPTGLRYETALATELSGDLARAATLFRAFGANAEALRLEGSLDTGSPTAAPSRAHALTRREEQIARLAARGFSNRQVADELHIGERTVETHVANAYRKLALRTRAELAIHFAELDAKA